MNLEELKAECEEIKFNAWQAYKRGDISREDALAIIGRAEKDLAAGNYGHCEHVPDGEYCPYCKDA